MTSDPEGSAPPVPLLDVNVLIALAWPTHVHHHRAQRWFRTRDSRSWGSTLITELGFIRLSSNRAVTGTTTLVSEAIRMFDRIRQVEGHGYVEDRSSLLRPLIDLGGVTSSRQTTDAHLVNLCASAGCVLATLDQAIPAFLSEPDRRHVLLLP